MREIIKKNWWWIIPVLVASFGVVSGIIIFHNDGLSLAKWDHQGFVEFFKYFDFPLKVLATSVLLLTICLSINRLHKTEKQIRISESGSLRSNYLELASSYQNDFISLKLDLKRNMNFFFPEMNEGKPKLDISIDIILNDIAQTILKVKSGNFGFVSGISLLPILAQKNTLRELLLIDFYFNTDTHTGLMLRSSLVDLAKDFVQLIEFISNFDTLLEPSDINSLKNICTMLERKQGELSNLFDSLKSKDSAHFINDVDSNHKLFAYYYILAHTKEDGADLMFFPDFGAINDYNNAKTNPKSDLNRYRGLREDLKRRFEENGDIFPVIKSENYKHLVNLIPEDAGSSLA
ncbi:MAG: hypothetical protein RLN88_00970 [Ekhidna sp.]|uniref:hypothetical protein n=1 Tax=Ekhidna sp. TaxID=2608089 RepID=UPI0032F04E9E